MAYDQTNPQWHIDRAIANTDRDKELAIASSQIAQALILQGIGNVLDDLVNQLSNTNVNLEAIWKELKGV